MSTSDSTIRPFHVDIPQAGLDDLRRRLSSTRYQPPLPADGWDTGIPSAYLHELVDAWTAFDWAGYQQRLNQTPQFSTVIDGQTIHFVHVPSREPAAIPLLLTHGWPGSFLEFLDLIGPLTDPAGHGGDPGDAFHVVIPSLPGFAFSTPLTSGGWTASRIAGTWVEVMSRLGYEQFAVHGGDIGATVSPEVARVAPERVIGVHVNGALSFATQIDDDTLAAMTDLDRDRAARTQAFMREESGYIAIQSTRPGLIGAALTDSPAAQLAWMLDKLYAWTYPADALPDTVLGREWILANASLYWLTSTGGSAAYVGYAQGGGWGAPPANSGVPTAAIQFAHDVGIRSQSSDANTIVHWTDIDDRGGHFAALEEPDILLNDIRVFLRSLR